MPRLIRLGTSRQVIDSGRSCLNREHSSDCKAQDRQLVRKDPRTSMLFVTLESSPIPRRLVAEIQLKSKKRSDDPLSFIQVESPIARHGSSGNDFIR
jgi:hypothetical protein